MPLTNAEKQARWRERQKLAGLRRSLMLEAVTVYLTPADLAEVERIIQRRVEAETDPEKRETMRRAMTYRQPD